MSEIKGKVVAITGASSGIGEATALALAGHGARVVLGARRLDRLETLAARIADEGGDAAYARTDVRRRDDLTALVGLAGERYGRLDVLISNAGVLSPSGRIHNLATEDWERAFRVNVLGAVNGIRAAVPVMREQGSGSIVLTASVAGLTAWSHAAPYCATKAAVIQLAKVAAVEYARDGIRVNCVCPGTFLSGIHAELPADAIASIAARHPLGLGSAADLVGAYSYLASDASRWTTGAAMVVDGGYAAP
jgi:3-oxoacyl-[acyl-carrier protein] reductase